ncbi:pectinesterase 2-like [Bidens hawaiensis]|uniref:pectinesterase 2-like n=1 Tax=Bidens hawaiensis TaxID=980011 RepID=UPI00404A90B4
MKILLFLATLFVGVFHPCVCGNTKSEIASWCSQTPHPQPCIHFLTNTNSNHGSIKQKPDFLKALLKVILDRAEHARSNTQTLGSQCRNDKEKAVWADCLELYENTVMNINRTVDPDHKCSQVDMQTWLSTALTNLDTCESGLEDLGVSGHMWPLMSNNVSALISNTLAMNEGGESVFGAPSPNNIGFPAWVKPGDRKLLQSKTPKADVVVDKDGSAAYKTIGAALASTGKRSGSRRYVIHVKAGVYKENIDIGSKLKNIMLVGDGIGKTIITGSKSVRGGSTTYKSATLAVVGDGFICRGITIKNTAGPKSQAVAFRSGSDLSAFYQCSFEGYQDTLYAHSNRQFYRQCDIYGTIDFIFGNAAAVFQNCNIYSRKGPTKTNTLTAQGRSDKNQNTGISIHNCRITAAPNDHKDVPRVRTYLGRPWRPYSRTVFMRSNLDKLIDPEGWMSWGDDSALKTLYYGEYKNTGLGSSTSKRVDWKGFHVITSGAEATKFTVRKFINGGNWLPATNVPFTSGL